MEQNIFFALKLNLFHKLVIIVIVFQEEHFFSYCMSFILLCFWKPRLFCGVKYVNVYSIRIELCGRESNFSLANK